MNRKPEGCPEHRDAVVLMGEVVASSLSAGRELPADLLVVSTVMADRSLWMKRLNDLADGSADPGAAKSYRQIAAEIEAGHPDRLAYYEEIESEQKKVFH